MSSAKPLAIRALSLPYEETNAIGRNPSRLTRGLGIDVDICIAIHLIDFTACAQDLDSDLWCVGVDELVAVPRTRTS